jgi:hypothetical protein
MHIRRVKLPEIARVLVVVYDFFFVYGVQC